MNRRISLSFVASGLLAQAATLGASGCDAVYPHDAPPGRIIFPISVALVPSPTVGEPAPLLLLANTDYDLRYRQGTLQSFDLDRVAAAVDACTERPCRELDVLPFLTDEVQIGPHVSGIAVSPRGNRVYLSVRSESDMTWIDVDGAGDLFCGDAEEEGVLEECDTVHRTTLVADDCGRTPAINGDAVSVVAGSVEALTGNADDAGLDWMMLVHRNGHASVFVDVLQGSDRVPTLVHELTGLPTDATNAVLDPFHNVVWMTTTQPPSSTVPPRTGTRDIPLIGISYDRVQPTCTTGFAAGRVAVRNIDDGLDSRDVGFADDERFVHVLSRRPESVLTLDMQGRPLASTDVLISDQTPMGTGPARLDIARVDGRELIVATAFGGHSVFVMDAETREAFAPVFGFQGPQDIVIDPIRGLAYVADFQDSVVRVVDLRPIALGGSPELALQLGVVTPVRSL